MTAKAEQKLAKQVSERDPAAMKALYDQYAGYLTALCSRYIDSEEDIKDLMQESFIRIFSGIRSFEFRGEGSLKAYRSPGIIYSRSISRTSMTILLYRTISKNRIFPTCQTYLLTSSKT